MTETTRRPALLRTERFDLDTGNGTIPVALRRDPRARRYTLRVKGALAAPVLTMPSRGSLKEARGFLDRHAGWLLRQIEKTPPPKPLADGSEIPFRGVPHRVRRSGSRRGAVEATLVDGAPTLLVGGEEAHLRRRLLDFLRREARRDLEAAVLGYSSALGVTARKVRVRDTSSRWGSCAASGALSFSFRLVMAPPFVLDYLAAHEVAHLREMNHSRRFWRLVEEICPATQAARAWLLAEGPMLHAIGAAPG